MFNEQIYYKHCTLLGASKNLVSKQPDFSRLWHQKDQERKEVFAIWSTGRFRVSLCSQIDMWLQHTQTSLLHLGASSNASTSQAWGRSVHTASHKISSLTGACGPALRLLSAAAKWKLPQVCLQALQPQPFGEDSPADSFEVAYWVLFGIFDMGRHDQWKGSMFSSIFATSSGCLSVPRTINFTPTLSSQSPP